MSKQPGIEIGDGTILKANDPLIELLASRIVKHLLENPNKKDTLRGICEWWLLQERIDYTINSVTIALELLILNGFIVEKTIAGFEKIYQLDKKKINDILKVFNMEREILPKAE